MTTFATRDWVTGEVVTAAVGNAQWRDNLNLVWVDVAGAAATVTSPVSVAGSVDVVTSGSVTFDGSSSCRIEFYAPYIALAATANATITLDLQQSGVDVGQVYQAKSSGGGDQFPCHFFSRVRTPAAGTYTFKIVASQANGTQTIQCGAGGAATLDPAFIRVWRRLS